MRLLRHSSAHCVWAHAPCAHRLARQLLPANRCPLGPVQELNCFKEVTAEQVRWLLN